MSFLSAHRPITQIAAGFLVAGLIAGSAYTAEPVSDGPVAAPIPAERYSLRYRFRPNDLVYYDVQHHSKVTIKGAQLQEVTTNDTTERKHFRVISVNAAGIGLLELTIDRVAMKVQFGQDDPIVFNSQSKKPAPPQFRLVQKSIGKPTARIRFAANGELKKVLLLNRVNKGAIGQLAVAPQTDANDPSHNFLLVFPTKSVAVGETWSDRIKVQVRISKSLLRPVTLLRKHTLRSVSGNLATIESNTVLLTSIRNAEIRTQLIQRTPTSTTVFDIERGLIVSRTTEIDKRQVGGITEKSSMHVKSRRVERLISPTITAARDGNAAQK